MMRKSVGIYRLVFTASGKSESGWVEGNRADIRGVAPQHLGAARDPGKKYGSYVWVLDFLWTQNNTLGVK